MKKSLVDIICCPVCKSPLILKTGQEDSDEILKGFLTCSKCEKNYKIKNGIPVLQI